MKEETGPREYKKAKPFSSITDKGCLKFKNQEIAVYT